MLPSEDIARALSGLEKRIERLDRLDQVFTINAGETVINEAGIDRNLRIEGLTDPNLVFVDAGLDNIGFGTATPLSRVVVNGQGFLQASNRTGFDPGDGSGAGLRLGYNLALDFGYIVANNTGVAGKNLGLQPTGGNVGVGLFAGFAATLHVDQLSAVGALPVLLLDQADVSEEMIEFVSTIGVGNAIEAVGAKTLTTTHFIKVTLPGGLTRYFPVGTIA